MIILWDSVHFPGSDYDFITFFDCLHDMRDPKGALTHTRNVIKKNGAGSSSNNNSGTCTIVEPFTQNELENNVNPVASTFYAASTLICVPNSLEFKRVLETPLNIVCEAKP